MKYFGDVVTNGDWESAENYLSAFIKLDDNILSRKTFFKMRIQKSFEALYRNGLAEAVNIFQDLNVFTDFQDESYKEMKELLSSKDFRTDQQLSWCSSNANARANLWGDLKTLIEQHPCFQDKLVLPKLNKSGLLSIMTLIYPNPEKKPRSIKEEITYLIHQFLDEENFIRTLHKLEQETKIFFNLSYFREFVINGKWDKAEKYLSAFIKLDDKCLVQRLFGQQVQKHLKGVGSETEFSSKYVSTESVKADFSDGLNQIIGKYPILQDKIKFPSMQKSRLLTIIKQIMAWWVPHCADSMSNFDDKTVSLDNIPKLPYLCFGPSFNPSRQETEELPMPSACGSNDSSCLADENSGVSMKLTENIRLSERNNCTHKGAMELQEGHNNETRVSNCLEDLSRGLAVKSNEKNTEISESSECCSLVLPYNSLTEKVCRLTYSHSGDFILALAQDATHKLWLLHSDSSGKVKTYVQPHLFQPSNGQTMTNEIGRNTEDTVTCFALKCPHLLSASGGKISIYSLDTYETINAFAIPPPVATYFIFLPQDLFAIGFDDSTILIHCPRTKKNTAKLKGHQKRVTCLAFSHNLNVLVSSGADSQLCVWTAAEWEKVASKFLHSLQTGHVPEPPEVTHIEFHKDQIQLLAVHEKHLDIYEAPMLNHLMQWVPPESDLPITDAAYSCDGESIYVSFRNGCIKVIMSKTLDLRCRINSTAYVQPNSSLEVYPIVIAAHPSKPHQFALGLNNGEVLILEPLESKGEWGMAPSSDDGDSSNVPQDQLLVSNSKITELSTERQPWFPLETTNAQM
ncbi:Topless-related protein [Quillaja saponaria]|nr:Topless-related protein [Quillaja saponaria]